jgi:hypothetical protein
MTKKILFGNLSVEMTESPDLVTYRFKGDVADSFKHRDVPRMKSKIIMLDLGGITNFNSCGVREWVYLIRDLGNLGSLVFVNCSIAMVDQFNMVPESVGRAHVQSFYAPYVCETHGDLEQLIDAESERNTIENDQIPERLCDACRKPLIFDAMPDSYFLFLAPTKGKLNKAS